ncbi:hypothetical protein AVEN_252239-1 [Araneus ventricosus]|uniref:Uncharacterized protein n=1 Tax=Araneus ventricosus TaxID=182803 RepID=A0A4Y2R1D9_ARAVE|nr:hypothetical protein AVEN_252239-1 [Araneus ventricosus]
MLKSEKNLLVEKSQNDVNPVALEKVEINFATFSVLCQAGHSRSLHTAQMEWEHSTPFQFSANLFKYVILEPELKPITYEHSDTLGLLLLPPLANQDSHSSFMVFAREPHSPLPHESTEVSFQFHGPTVQMDCKTSAKSILSFTTLRFSSDYRIDDEICAMCSDCE